MPECRHAWLGPSLCPAMVGMGKGSRNRRADERIVRAVRPECQARRLIAQRISALSLADVGRVA